MTASATEFSLADFFHGEGEDPLTPPEDFTWWRAETAWAASLSKAFAGVGGFVSGRREIIDYLRCYSTPDGFSCALPPSAVAALLAGLEVATRDHSLRERLWANAEYFREDTIVSRLGKAT
jgi:7-keto-8-aminopelargonate synthetase-like enzyme